MTTLITFAQVNMSDGSISFVDSLPSKEQLIAFGVPETILPDGELTRHNMIASGLTSSLELRVGYVSSEATVEFDGLGVSVIMDVDGVEEDSREYPRVGSPSPERSDSEYVTAFTFNRLTAGSVYRFTVNNTNSGETLSGEFVIDGIAPDPEPEA